MRRCTGACSRSRRSAPRRKAWSGSREAEAWALESLPEPDALRALGWTRALRGVDIDEVCAQFDAAAGRART